MKTSKFLNFIFVVLFSISFSSYAQTILISEDFSSGILPVNWSNIDNASTGDLWAFNDPGSRGINAGNISENYAILDSDFYGSGSSQNAVLTTSSFNATPFITITLEYDYQYRNWSSSESITVEVYNGTSWTTVKTYQQGDENWNGASTESIDITAAVFGSSASKVRFTYVGSWDYWFILDNFKVTGTGDATANSITSPTGPGGIGSGDGSTNLNLWLQADQGVTFGSGTSISSWADQSGNGNNVSQGTASKMPTQTTGSINSYPTVTFDGSNDQLNSPEFGSVVTKSAHTSFLVWKYNGGYPAKYESIFASTNSSSSETLQFSSSGNTASDRFQFVNKDIATHSSFASFNITTIERTSSNTLTGWVNESTTVNTTIGSTAGRDFYLYKFGVNRNGNKYLNAELAESIIFHRDVTEVERIIINNYLSAKYGISLDANDYYTQDNPANGNFDYNVAGIGRAADGSIHNNSQGTGIVKINSPSDLGFDEFLFWGENTKETAYNFSTSSDYMERVSSTWRVSKRNNLGTVTVSVSATDINPVSKQSCTALRLAVSSFSDFSSKTSYDLTLTDGVYSATNVSFSDGDYFSFEYQDVIAVDGTKFYNGSGASSKPNTSDACYKLLVKNTSTGALALSENANVREVELETGGLVTLNSNIALTITGNIINNGTFTIKENASLIQNTTGANSNSGSGSYDIIRSGNNSPYVYNIWSAPISNASITSVFTDANPCDVWVFDRTTQAWSHDFAVGFATSCNGNNVTFSASDVITGGDGVMDVTGGYFVPGSATMTKTYSGNINNGDYAKPIAITNLGNPGGTDWADDDWNLLGNPYPSALSATAFWNENAINNGRIMDALYFWDEADTTGGYNENSDYASWNLSGGVNSGNTAEIPSGNIASGQGFWVVAKANTNVIFNNSMRAVSNSQFFKSEPTQNQHNAWISFTSPSLHQNNILVGYNNITTDAEDDGYDAHKLVGNANLRFASYIGTDEYVIQSVAPLAYGDSKTIALIVTSNEAGIHTFSGYKRENLPSDFKIFLRDKVLGIDLDLGSGDYTVDLDAGVEYTTRFELVFKNKIKINDDGNGSKGSNNNGNGGSDSTVTGVNENIQSDFVLIQNQDEIIISNKNGLQGNIQIYNIAGKLMWTKEGVENSNSQTISWSSFSAGSYFITISNGNERLFMKQVVKP